MSKLLINFSTNEGRFALLSLKTKYLRIFVNNLYNETKT